MLKQTLPTMCSKQRGMLLIEVMVALLLFVVGILGLVQAMNVSQSAQSDAQFRADAATHASNIVQQIWLRVDHTTAAAFDTSLATFQHLNSGTACAFSGTASTNTDVTDWIAKVRTGSTALPGATAAMQQVRIDVAAGNRVTVTLCWQGPKDTAPRKHIYSAYVNENFK
jgi:type IV pilus assembly protein PilV